jgi:hypothetical protein
MSKGSWLKAHRKKVITHTSIVVVFVLFIIFVSVPLFDRLEAVQGESRLHQFSLPAETNDIRYGIDAISPEDPRVVEIRGWAFIEDEDSEGSEAYIVLESASRTYIFDTMLAMRPDITRNFKELDLNLDRSGFTALIPARKIADGEYAVGIYITKGDIEALMYTNRTIVK